MTGVIKPEDKKAIRRVINILKTDLEALESKRNDCAIALEALKRRAESVQSLRQR